jgi:hypothetical protein
MSYQPQYQYSYTPARPAHHWADLLVKVGGLLAGVTAAAVMGAHLIRVYSPPARTAPISQIVAYYSKGGQGAMGANQHWTMEASEGAAEWHRAVRYCQAQAQTAQNVSWSDGASAQHTVPGCATINTLSESGY